MKKLHMKTKDLANEKFQKLKELFPNAITEIIDEYGNRIRAIDKDVLTQEIATEVVEGREERYQFTWPDKSKAVLAANNSISKTLRPFREESINFDETENLYIEGDNLEILKLLQETYLGKIKMIYIDPPYNTGSDFVYNDRFSIDRQKYLEGSGQFDEEGNRMEINLESNGRFHTDWLNMMYPRLKLAKNLLTHDGVIFISIDDNEHANLKKICDEIFGEDNFVNSIAVKMSEASGVKMNHQNLRFPKIKEYILFYKNNDFKGFNKIDKYKIKEWDIENNIYLKNFNYEDRLKLKEYEEKEQLNDNDLEKINKILSKIERESLSKVIQKQSFKNCNEENEWLFDNAYRIIKTAGSASLVRLVKERNKQHSQEIAAELSAEGILFYYITDFNRDVVQPRFQVIFADSGLYKNPCDFWQDIKTTGAIANEGGVLYKNGKKPLQLLKRMITMTTSQNDIILDFFAGSSSTAHAVMQLNAEDGEQRKFIMAQLPEDLDETLKKTSGEAKKDIKNLITFLDKIKKPHLLTEVGKERIRRSGKIILDSKKEKENIKKLDIGFRVLKVDSSNMKDVYYSPAETDQNLLDMLSDNIKEDRTPEDLLFQIMLDLGVSLSSKIERDLIDEKEIFVVKDGFLIACFDKNISNKTVKAIANKKPYYAVFRDFSMENDSVATNFEQIFDSASPQTIRRII